MNKENLKQVLISIFIGAFIAFLSTLMDSLVDYLQGVRKYDVGAVAGVVWYFKTWNRTRIG